MNILPIVILCLTAAYFDACCKHGTIEQHSPFLYWVCRGLCYFFLMFAGVAAMRMVNQC